MKKKILTLFAVAALSTGVITDCAQDENVQGNVIHTEDMQEESQTTQDEENAETTELTATMDEIKDFMFIVTDENGVSYAFSFEEKPDGLSDVAVGDKVTVTYTGTVSEIDGFDGEIISIEKQL